MKNLTNPRGLWECHKEIRKKKKKGERERIEWKENTSYQNLWIVVKAVPRGKLTTLNAYLIKLKRSEINDLTSISREEKIKLK